MWSLRYALTMVVLGLLGQFVLAALLLPLAGVDLDQEVRPEDLPGWWTALVMVLVNALLLVAVYMRDRRDRSGGGDGLPGWIRPRWGAIGLGLLVGLAGFGFNVAFTSATPLDIAETAFAQAFRTPVDFAMLGVAVLLAAPVFEEVVFRGLLFHAWLPSGRVSAVLGTTVLFAAPHLLTYREEPLALVPIAVLGLGLGGLRLVTGSVLPCIVAHACFNALGYLSGLVLD